MSHVELDIAVSGAVVAVEGPIEVDATEVRAADRVIDRDPFVIDETPGLSGAGRDNRRAPA